ncbi:hypothetical protein SAMN02745216_00925 [Desulfatibacillum alkenivorans DSM 16219]|jgi:MFS family permease|uniref:Uncharacterized protein n=1 Tax=Desulfatibacillum alkenivorans DSM 16219 TaxID=1121393 RepID=A0A1M6FVR6_9BACT|nr:hypothetical protein [Desulfatibacillum alkenivorans]SHJ01798.1 hypothetical protein SAMN02745216_00925 [Desulfatibacillum alkenivorans DSM 16219]
MSPHIPQEKGVMTWLPGLLLALAVIAFSAIGFITALICIFALPDHTVRPWAAAGIYFACSLPLSVLVYVFGRVNLRKYSLAPEEEGGPPPVGFVLKEGASDKALKWIVLIYPIIFGFWGVMIGLICIFALPDETVQPQVSVCFFIASVIIMLSSLLAVIKTTGKTKG